MFAPFDYRREISQQRDTAKLVYIAVNSIAAYILAYLLTTLIYQFATGMVAASLFYIKTVIYYYKIDFRVGADYWNKPRVIGTFLSGPLISLAAGIIFWRVYRMTKKQPGWGKTFMLWTYLHAFNLFFGSYVAGVITRSGFRFVTNWMAVPEKAEFVISFFCVAFMFTVGYFATRNFLQTSVSQSLIQRFTRPYFILCTVILPWLAGSGLLLVAKYPGITMNEMITYLMMFTIVVPVVIVQRTFQEVNLVKHSSQVSIAWPIVATAIGTLALYRYLFEDGVVVGAWLRGV